MAALALRREAAETLAILTLRQRGHEIVSTTSLYGGTYNLSITRCRAGRHRPFRSTPRRSRVARGDQRKNQAFTQRPSAPELDIVDIEKLAGVAHENGLPLSSTTPLRRPPCAAPSNTAPTSSSSLTKFIAGTGLDRRRDHRRRKFDWKASGRFPDFTTPDPSYTESFIRTRLALLGHPQVRVQALRDIGA